MRLLFENSAIFFRFEKLSDNHGIFQSSLDLLE